MTIFVVSSIYNGISGAVYVFEQVDGLWRETAKLTDEVNANMIRMFGYSIDSSNDSLIIGSIPQHQDGVLANAVMINIYKPSLLNRYIIHQLVELNTNSVVNIVSSDGNKYVLNGGTEYMKKNIL